MTKEQISKYIVSYQLNTDKVISKLKELEEKKTYNEGILEREANNYDHCAAFLKAHADNEIARTVKQIDLMRQTLQVLGE